MKIALVTTTIHVPEVLAEYRRLDRDREVEIIVAGDVIGPQAEIETFCRDIDARYLSYQEQASLGYRCHAVIGPRSIQRRNIATLEAIKGGADLILTVDTDNRPCAANYFSELDAIFAVPAFPITYQSSNGWFNIGDYATDDYIVRGYPVSLWHDDHDNNAGEGAKPVGVFSSLVFGDPDVGAVERLRMQPQVESYVIGLTILDPVTTWAPINSQCTAWRRELAPLAFVLPHVGRYDDIWAGYIAQRVLEVTDYAVAFGFPAVRQERHPHNLLRDLEAELHGMRHTEAFVALLKEARVSPANTVLDNLTYLVDYLRLAAPDDVLPQQTKRFLSAWVEDVTAVLACSV